MKHLTSVLITLLSVCIVALVFYFNCINTSDTVRNEYDTEESVSSLSVNTSVSISSTDCADREVHTYVLSENNTELLVVSSEENEEPASIDDTYVRPDTITFYQSSYHSSFYEDVSFYTNNDTLYIEIPYTVSDGDLTNAHVVFSLTDGSCFFEGMPAEDSADYEESEISLPEYINEDLSVDLTKNPILHVTDYLGNSSVYHVEVKRLTGDIPVLYLSTDTHEPVTSRYEYVSGNLLLEDSVYEVSLRGRGNASWWKFPQKSYMIRFEEEVSLFGMTSSDKWVLASTYADLSLIRNCVAMNIASYMDNLEFTASQIPVDVFMNGEYLGVYTFSEKIEVASDKIDLFSECGYFELVNRNEPDIGFLLECGGYIYDSYTYGQDYFSTAHSPGLYFQYPEFEEPNTPEYQFILEYMTETDRAITRGYGYEEYIDVDSWVDWFIVMELTNNTDSALCRSTYLYRRPGGKLMIGPVWDFDMAFGNFYYDNPTYACWATAEAIYAPAQNHFMTYLYNSDTFMLQVRERWDEVKDELLEIALDSIDDYGEAVAYSRQYNNQVRGISYSSYQLNAMRNFVQQRYDWIDASIHMDDFNRHPATISVPVFEDENQTLFVSGNGISENTVSANAVP